MTSWTDRLLAPFQRETSSGRYLPEIDGLRCLAVVMVVLFHLHGFFATYEEPSTVPDLIATGTGQALEYLPHAFIGRGWFGVQIFFVISGLVLSLPYVAHYSQGEPRPLARNYFRRRLIRIEVPYFIALTFSLGVALLYGSGGLLDQLPHYAAGLIYAHAFFFNGEMNPILHVAWTLELEVQFYLMVPLLCRVFALGRAARRTLLVVAIVAVDLLAKDSEQGISRIIWQFTVLGQLEWFLCGLLLADLYLSPVLSGIREGGGCSKLDLLGLVAWMAVFVLIDFTFTMTPRPFVMLLAFWCVLAGRHLGALFRNRWLTSIGVMCYTIYLFHNFFIHVIIGPHVLNQLIPVEKGNWPLNAFILLFFAGVVIVLCGFVYLVVEKPFARGRMPWRAYRQGQ